MALVITLDIALHDSPVRHNDIGFGHGTDSTTTLKVICVGIVGDTHKRKHHQCLSRPLVCQALLPSESPLWIIMSGNSVLPLSTLTDPIFEP